MPKLISSFVSGNGDLCAEMLWALRNVIEKHYSYNICENISELFRKMFPDSHIATKFSCGEKVCIYVCIWACSTLQLMSKVKSQVVYVLYVL